MSKKECCLVCPSCKVFELDLKDNKFFCKKCDLFYKIKDGYPILINFNLENVLIEEIDIKIKKKKYSNK